jgi:enterochelin esterase-like enzyme
MDAHRLSHLSMLYRTGNSAFGEWMNLIARWNSSATIVVCLLLASFSAPAQTSNTQTAGTKLRFEISFPAQLSAKTLDGHLMLGLSKSDKEEPRFQLDETEAESQQFFSLDVDALAPDKPAVIDANALGYPVRSLADLPPGDYYVQAVLNIYETFHRSDGHVVKLPPDMGEGQQWNKKPGNLFSKPQKLHVDSNAGVIRISLTEKISSIEPPKDTKYIKHVRIQSKLLSEFWGRPMFIGAHILLPAGFEEHPNAHYPVLVYQDHFSPDFRFFSEQPPKPDLKGRELDFARSKYQMYLDWASGRLPHMIMIDSIHPNPYYDDSYAVNSANVGPYGDAIMKELLPAVEKQFRAIGQPWARVLMGGSTGGWETLADQVFYPDDFNGAWCFCPDPIDFHAYQSVNIYDDKNAFWVEGDWSRIPRAEMRDTKGNVLATMEPTVRREEVMGTHGRSTEQFGIWQAVFSPVGPDGYPKPIWDPTSGVIDKDVANYWRDHYDLTHIMERDWATLGPKLSGKLHFAVGDMDTWYLNNAVHILDDFMHSPKNTYKVPDFDYGPRKPHCYTGGANVSVFEAVGTLFQRIMPKMAEHIKATAPKDGDMSWEY